MLRTFRPLLILATLAAPFLATTAAHAYVDLAPTLGRVIAEAQKISVVEVEKASADRRQVILKEVRTLRGDKNAEQIRHRLSATPTSAVPRHLLEWAEPGSRGVLFLSNNVAVVCVGEGWYQVHAANTGWWTLGAERPDLPLAYYGSVSRLADALELILANKDAIITTLPHGEDAAAASFDVTLNRATLPGLVHIQRVRAGLRMPGNVMAMSNGAYVVGFGQVDAAEIPSLVEKLRSSDNSVRAEAAGDLRSLGSKATQAIEPLAALVNDASPRVRHAAAAAITRISAKDERGIKVLSRDLESPDIAVRRSAARAVALAGPHAGSLAPKIGKLLKDENLVVRGTALQAVATLGPAAAKAAPDVIPLLEDPALQIDAADALGRIGTAARPAPAKLIAMLSSDQQPVRWAAVRGLSQIGGPEAHPTVEFMIRELPRASIVDGYNMMIYLALLGPVAKDAIPAIQSARVMQPALKSATLWAIEPEKSFPWQNTGRGMVGPGAGRFSGPGMEARGPGVDPRGPGNDAQRPGGDARGPGMDVRGPGGPELRLPGPGMGAPPDGGLDVFGSIYEAYIHELGDRLAPAAINLAKAIAEGKAGNVPSWGYKLLNCGTKESLEILTPLLAEKDLIVRERAAVALGYMGATAASARSKVSIAVEKASNERERKLLQWCLKQVSKEREV